MPSKQLVVNPGMNEGIDPRNLPEGTPRLLQNVRIRQGARFDKRPGAASLGITGEFDTDGTGCWVAEQTGAPVVAIQHADGDQKRISTAYRRDAASYWRRLGNHGLLVPERRFGIALDDAEAGLFHSCAVVGGVLYLAYQGNTATTTVSIYAIDPDGTVVSKTTQSDAAQPRLVYANSVLYLVTREPSGSGTDIEVRTLNPSTLALTAPTTLSATLAASSDIFDAASVEGGTTWIVAYPDGATSLRVIRMAATDESESVSVATTAKPACIGVAAYQGEYVCVGYLDDTTIEATFLVTATLSSNATRTVRAAAGSEVYRCQACPVRTDVNKFKIVTGGDDSSTTVPSAFLVHAEVSQDGTLVGPYKVFHLQPCSKPWRLTGNDGEQSVQVWAHNNANSVGFSWVYQARHFVLELGLAAQTGGDNLVAISYEHIAERLSGLRYLPEAPTFGSGRFATVLLWDDPGDYAGIDVAVWYSATSTDSMRWSHRHAVESGGALYISGGLLSDSPECTIASPTHYIPENGFPYAPEISAAIATGGAMTAGLEYDYQAVFAWRDAIGRVHRSAPSRSQTATPTGSHRSVVVTYTTLAGTGKAGQVSAAPEIELYRSWNGGPHYHLNGIRDTVTASSAEDSLTDAANDSSTEDNRTIYTDSGVLPNEPPSGARLLAIGGNRAFTVGWRPNVLQFSKLYIATAPWEFCDDDTFRIFFPQELTALAWMDGVLVAFSENRIYLVTGDGPNDQGVGSFSEPRELPATVGADSPHVVEVPQGLMYSGAGTIWLLPRGFGPPQPVGDAIQEVLGRFPNLRAAVRCSNADDDVTHFVLAATDLSGAETKVAIWDNRLATWSIDDVAGEVGAAGAVDGQFTWLLPSWSALSSLPARQLDVTQYQDYDASGSSAWIESRVEFGDFRPFGPLGWGKLNSLQLHGQVSGTCRMNLDATCGLSGYTVQQTCTAVGERYWEHAVKHPQEGSFRFAVYDSILTAYNGGIALHSVGYTHSQPEDGLRRLSNEERF